MCLPARDRTRLSWLGVDGLLMERFRSWSRCVYNYTLGNRILSVYKRRMFWQALQPFENSLRKQLWVPSALLPLATDRALGHQHPAPSPPAPRSGPPPSGAAFLACVLETATAPRASPAKPVMRVCVETCAVSRASAHASPEPLLAQGRAASHLDCRF